MLASGEIMKNMVKELIFMQMEINMLASGEMIKNMVKGRIFTKMEEPKQNITDLRTNLNFYIF